MFPRTWVWFALTLVLVASVLQARADDDDDDDNSSYHSDREEKVKREIFDMTPEEAIARFGAVRPLGPAPPRQKKVDRRSREKREHQPKCKSTHAPVAALLPARVGQISWFSLWRITLQTSSLDVWTSQGLMGSHLPATSSTKFREHRFLALSTSRVEVRSMYVHTGRHT